MSLIKLRWLNAEGERHWLGHHEGEVVAQVYPGDIVGNRIDEWHWRLLTKHRNGSVRGTDDEVKDISSAQKEAEIAYSG